MARSNLSGAWGEALAGEYLRKKRYTLVAANYRCKFGEIDLIVKDRRHLVFVEVKLRKSPKFAQALEYVDRHKQDRLRITASIHPSSLCGTLDQTVEVLFHFLFLLAVEYRLSC